MRRRTMVQAALGAALIGTLPRHGSGTAACGDHETLAALAATVVPVTVPLFWRDSPEARSLRERFESQGPADRERTLEVLERLDSEAGGNFSALALERRTTLLAGLIAKDEALANVFGLIRTLVLDTFFTGGAGLTFTGYRDCTQFEGYPEYLSISTGWE